MQHSLDKRKTDELYRLAFDAFFGVDEARVREIREVCSMPDILYAYDNLAAFWKLFSDMEEDEVIEFHRMKKEKNVVSIMNHLYRKIN